MMDDPIGRDNADLIDPAVLPGLFARLGPRVAAELQHHLGVDLRTTHDGLGAALGPPVNLQAVARQMDVLAALAGTAGAAGLAARARTLMRAAQQGNAGISARMASDILPRIDALVAFVATCPPPADPPPR